MATFPLSKTTTKINPWPDWTNLGLAAWLFCSPWIAALAGPPPAQWNAWLVGAAVAGIAMAAVARLAAWQQWSNLTLGAWALVAPWLLGFSAAAGATWNHVAVGLLIACLAGWQLRAMQNRPKTAPAE